MRGGCLTRVAHYQPRTTPRQPRRADAHSRSQRALTSHAVALDSTTLAQQASRSHGRRLMPCGDLAHVKKYPVRRYQPANPLRHETVSRRSRLCRGKVIVRQQALCHFVQQRHALCGLKDKLLRFLYSRDAFQFT